jgi:hypothetical protein
MRTRRAVNPRLEALEDRLVLSAVGSHLVSSATAEIHKLRAELHHTIQRVQHHTPAHQVGHANQSHTTPHSSNTSNNPFSNFFKSIF